MTSMTALQRKTVNCCVFGSAILGDFKAREIAAKDRIPSVQRQIYEVEEWKPAIHLHMAATT